MAKRGRPRKDRARQPNGRLREAPHEGLSPVHLQALGVNPKERSILNGTQARRIAAGARARDERASTPLGMMLALRLLDELDPGETAEDIYRAAETYELNQQRLGRHVGVPTGSRSQLASLLAGIAPAVYAGMGEENDDFASQYRRCRWVEREITARVWDWRGLEDFLVKHELPEFFTAPGTLKAAHRLKTLQHDLVEVAHFYRKPPRREEMRGPRPRLRILSPRAYCVDAQP